MTDFAALLRALSMGRVRFIVIGGVAAVTHGSARLTADLDVVYDRATDNLEHLVAAMAPHSPYVRGAPAGLPFRFDVDTLRRGLNFTLTSALGEIDLFGEIAGGGSYDRLLADTHTLRCFGIEFRCLSLRRLIDVKRAAGRPKEPQNNSRTGSPSRGNVKVSAALGLFGRFIVPAA